jgi:hypothetical protein
MTGPSIRSPRPSGGEAWVPAGGDVAGDSEIAAIGSPPAVLLLPPPAPLRWPFPAQRPPDDRGLLLLTELALGRSRPGNHPQDPGRWAWHGRLPGARRRRRCRGGRRLFRSQVSATMLQGPECGFQRQDRAGPFGGQELCCLSAGALQFQGMLKRVDAVLAAQASAGWPVAWWSSARPNGVGRRRSRPAPSRSWVGIRHCPGCPGARLGACWALGKRPARR